MVIRPAFSSLGSGFSDGLACVKQGDKWGYIDRKGNFKIEPRFREATDFSDGLAAVKPDHLWGYIDKAGKVAIPVQYRDCAPFSEGLAAVKVRGQWGFIDTQGHTVLKPQLLRACAFRKGLARVETASGGWAYVSRNGQIVWQQKELGPDQTPAIKRVIDDDEVGLTARALVKKYGPPRHKHEFRVDEAVDEMRFGLRFRLPQSQAKAGIQEYFYVYDSGDQRFFWLVQDKTGNWVVFSNLFVPVGVAF
jgi:hypothetical protein